MPRVSIITPCYNAARYVGEMIESVQQQTFTDWEHIVVDDGSTDESARVVRRYSAGSERLTLIQQENQGVSAARNAGVRTSDPESEYLLFVDADDVLMPTMLERLVEYLDNHPEVGVVSCYPVLIDAEGNELEGHWNPTRYEATSAGLRKIPTEEVRTSPLGVFIGTIAPFNLTRKEAFIKTTGFDPELTHCEDTDVFAQIALRSEVHRIPEHLAYYRQHDAQAMSNKARLKRQRRALADKWKTPIKGLTEKQQDLREQTWRHWHGRYVPLTWMQHARSEAERGNLSKALVLFAAAVFRYLFFAVSTDDELYYRLQRWLEPSL